MAAHQRSARRGMAISRAAWRAWHSASIENGGVSARISICAAWRRAYQRRLRKNIVALRAGASWRHQHQQRIARKHRKCSSSIIGGV